MDILFVCAGAFHRCLFLIETNQISHTQIVSDLCKKDKWVKRRKKKTLTQMKAFACSNPNQEDIHELAALSNTKPVIETIPRTVSHTGYSH